MTEESKDTPEAPSRESASGGAPYSPDEIEPKWLRRWERGRYFHGIPDPHKKPYSIVIPPPNVTDVLHLGHALNNTIQDTLIRRHRMNGYAACWFPGTDHAGIATQVIVEKRIAKEGLTRRKLGREKFVERVHEFALKNRETILGQLKRMGSSCDWERTAFTIDTPRSRAVAEAFVRLYDKDLIYRGNRIVNWCVSCQTSLSDDEVIHEEQHDSLWYIRYKVKGSEEYLTVATTRPETMLGDTAVAVNPKDKRYQGFKGKSVMLPLLDREIPVVADDYVDPTFGTGVVKITPAHDPNDWEVARRHSIAALNILTPDGKINDNGGRFAGLERMAARKLIVQELEALELVEKVEPHTHNVGTCYRCDNVIEPYLSDQWFVKMTPLAEPALKAYQDGKLRFHPEHWGKTYVHWLDNIRDWCISRQLWWGHRIPIYYCDGCGAVSASAAPLSSCPKCHSDKVRQDEDVLDTWFSSWLWPLSTMGWPDDTPELKYFYPTKVLSTASEIIFLWVARMVMAGYEFKGELCFSDVYIHGTVRDANGVKMSKSLGNGIDPLEIIGKYGADALRMSLILSTPDGQDPWLSKNSFEQGRNFVNKIYQVSRFLTMRTPAGATIPYDTYPARATLSAPDRWILARLNQTIAGVNQSFDNYRLSAAIKTLYDFLWNDYCSWYVELIKPDSPGEPILKESLTVANFVLEHGLRLLHPFAPFVTEELLMRIRAGGESETHTISFGPWPSDAAAPDITTEDAQALEGIKTIVEGVRSLRAEMNVPPGRKCDLVIRVKDAAFAKTLDEGYPYFRSLARVEKLTVGQKVKKPPLCASLVVSGAEVFVPLEGLIDIAQERARLEKALNKLRDALDKQNRKLGNQDFLANAPEDIITREKAKKADYEDRIVRLDKNLEQLTGW